jgi:hypothetical protein
LTGRVFICYSSQDRSQAEEICRLLEAQSIPCWIAPRNVMPGRNYGEEIINALESASVMVLVFSQRSNDSRHVQNEVGRAINKNKHVIPYRIADVQPSKALDFYIGETQWLDGWIPPQEARIAELAIAIKSLFTSDADRAPGMRPAPPSTLPVADTGHARPSEPAAQLVLHHPSRVRWFAISGIVLLAVVAFAALWLVVRPQDRAAEDAYRNGVTRLLLDQDTLEQHIRSIADSSSANKYDTLKGKQYIEQMSEMAIGQAQLQERADRLNPPSRYRASHTHLRTMLDLWRQRVTLWQKAKAEQLRTSYEASQPSWDNQVAAYRKFRAQDTMIDRECEALAGRR